ncbi:MAG: DUF86 domain-containing protein [Patescibacteria group bacterium]
MKKNLNVYLTDVLRAVADVQTYTVDVEMDVFFTDRMLQAAVLYKLAVIGEAVARIPAEMKKSQKSIPWEKIVGMRNVVIHDYSDVDLRVVWEVVKHDLPELVQATQKILKERS